MKNLNPKQKELLEHIGRYRLSTRQVIERMFFHGRSSDNALRSLIKSGRIEVIKNVLMRRFSYYQLSPSEAQRLGHHVPKAAHDKVVRRNLAVLLYCCMTNPSPSEGVLGTSLLVRRRLTSPELTMVAQGQILNSPHVAQRHGQDLSLLRLYMPAPGTNSDRLIESLRDDALKLVEHPTLASWAANRTYRFVVLVEHETVTDQLKLALSRREMPDGDITVDTVPSFDSVNQSEPSPMVVEGGETWE